MSSVRKKLYAVRDIRVKKMIEKWGSNSRKITADIYIDDKAELPVGIFLDEAV